MPKMCFVMENLPQLQYFVKIVVSNAKGKITGKTLCAQTVMPSKNAFVYLAGWVAKMIKMAKYSSVMAIFVRNFLIVF